MTLEDLAHLHARAMVVPSPWSARDFSEVLRFGGTFLAPCSEQELTGFALGRVILDEAELLTIAVDPNHRGRGLGRNCLSGFEAEAARRGARTAHLEVAATNEPALALYRSAGWVENGLRKAYYRAEVARIDAILMSKRLPVA